ncbi:hypothetical protein IJ732_06235 [bacterium]|nr:hypothetical protein [bacterium]
MANSYSNFFNSGNTFGVNVKRTETAPQKQTESHVQQQAQQNIESTHNFFKPVEKLVGTVMDVFNGNVQNEVNKYRVLSFNTELIMHEADVKVNGQKPTFDMTF